MQSNCNAISVYAPDEPGVPTLLYIVYIPEAISEPPPCVPLLVVENLKGWFALLESDWSNLYVFPGTKLKCGDSIPFIL